MRIFVMLAGGRGSSEFCSKRTSPVTASANIAEAALRRTNDKFVRRFDYVEKHLDSTQTNLKAMDALWDEIKEKEQKGE